MKNKEKFLNEIAELAIQWGILAVDKQSNKIVPCSATRCVDCLFYGEPTCGQKFLEWANSEYKEKKEFSNIDKTLVKGLNKLNWFARNKSGDVYGFVNRPLKRENCWFTNEGLFLWLDIYSSANFEPLSWDDDEPVHKSEILGE